MPRDMFTGVTRPPAGLGSQAWYTVPASILTHGAIVAILVIIPLVVNDVVPLPTPDMILVAAPPPPPPPPEIVQPPAPTKNPPAGAPMTSGAPTTPPDNIGKEEPRPPALPDVPGADRCGSTLPGIVGGTGIVGVPDPPAPAVVTPVRPGGKVKYPEKIRDVRPVYPQIAVTGGVEGTVIIEAIIGVDGRVKDARVLRSIPLLDRAALDAVNQWIFSPTLLNDVPVPVIITVTVAFKLR